MPVQHRPMVELTRESPERIVGVARADTTCCGNLSFCLRETRNQANAEAKGNTVRTEQPAGPTPLNPHYMHPHPTSPCLRRSMLVSLRAGHLPRRGSIQARTGAEANRPRQQPGRHRLLTTGRGRSPNLASGADRRSPDGPPAEPTDKWSVVCMDSPPGGCDWAVLRAMV